MVNCGQAEVTQFAFGYEWIISPSINRDILVSCGVKRLLNFTIALFFWSNMFYINLKVRLQKAGNSIQGI